MTIDTARSSCATRVPITGASRGIGESRAHAFASGATWRSWAVPRTPCTTRTTIQQIWRVLPSAVRSDED